MGSRTAAGSVSRTGPDGGSIGDEGDHGIRFGPRAGGTLMHDRFLLRDAMDAVLAPGWAATAGREQRLAEMQPERSAAEIREAFVYCGRAEAEAAVCADQVRQARLTFDSALACLAEQFPELDVDQLRRAFDLAIGRSRG